MITRRASVKRIWPNVWTNSCCGHPGPGERYEAAIERRLNYELGLPMVGQLECLVPNYIYTTPPYNEIIENEFCPIYVGVLDVEPVPNPDEVQDYRWVRWQWLLDEVANDPHDPGVYSYWVKDQLRILAKNPHIISLVQAS